MIAVRPALRIHVQVPMRNVCKNVSAPKMALTLDRREAALSEALRPLREHFLQDLPVGDVHCKYDDGTEWILERKTARDLAH